MQVKDNETKLVLFDPFNSNNPENEAENENEKGHRMSYLMDNLQKVPKSHRTLSSNEFNDTVNSIKSNQLMPKNNHY